MYNLYTLLPRKESTISFSPSTEKNVPWRGSSALFLYNFSFPLLPFPIVSNDSRIPRYSGKGRYSIFRMRSGNYSRVVFTPESSSMRKTRRRSSYAILFPDCIALYQDLLYLIRSRGEILAKEYDEQVYRK